MVTDETLVEAFTEGDQAAFETFHHRYQAPMLGYLEHLLKDRETAEDIGQETFIKLFRELRSRTAPDSVSAWMYRVAGNLCRDYWRSAGYRKEKQILDQLREPEDRQAGAVDICERQESRMEMFALLNELPEAQRETVILRFYHELKLQEIAEVTGCPIGTVKSRLFHALRFLKNRIEESGRVNYG